MASLEIKIREVSSIAFQTQNAASPTTFLDHELIYKSRLGQAEIDATHFTISTTPPFNEVNRMIDLMAKLTNEDIRNLIDAGIAVLDARGGDPDLECSGDAEPEW